MHLKRLFAARSDDVDLVCSLLLDAPDYWLSTFGGFPSTTDAHSVLSEFPEACTAENQLIFGVCEKTDLVGLIRVLRSWPTPEVAVIELLLIRKSFRRRHFACRAIEQLSRQARSWTGISKWKISVLESNPGALEFWRHCGFQEGTRGLRVRGLTGPVTNLERRVKAHMDCTARIEAVKSRGFAH